MKKLLLIFLTSTLWGCVSPDEQKGIDAVQNLIQAEDISIGSGSSIDSHTGQIKYKSLTLKSGSNLNRFRIFR